MGESALKFYAVGHSWKRENAGARGEEVSGIIIGVEADEVTVQDTK